MPTRIGIGAGIVYGRSVGGDQFDSMFFVHANGDITKLRLRDRQFFTRSFLGEPGAVRSEHLGFIMEAWRPHTLQMVSHQRTPTDLWEAWNTNLEDPAASPYGLTQRAYGSGDMDGGSQVIVNTLIELDGIARLWFVNPGVGVDWVYWDTEPAVQDTVHANVLASDLDFEPTFHNLIVALQADGIKAMNREGGEVVALMTTHDAYRVRLEPQHNYLFFTSEADGAVYRCRTQDGANVTEIATFTAANGHKILEMDFRRKHLVVAGESDDLLRIIDYDGNLVHQTAFDAATVMNAGRDFPFTFYTPYFPDNQPRNVCGPPQNLVLSFTGGNLSVAFDEVTDPPVFAYRAEWFKDGASNQIVNQAGGSSPITKVAPASGSWQVRLRSRPRYAMRSEWSPLSNTVVVP